MSGLFVVECIRCDWTLLSDRDMKFGVDYGECKCGARSFRGTYAKAPEGYMKVWDERGFFAA